ncbi:MAG: serine hydrolase domain-containing protein [Nocardioides sp.]
MTAWTDVARELEALAAQDRFSGVVLVTRGGTTLLEGAAGWADRAHGAPVTPATRFATASLSKMFTAAAVLSCVRDGLLEVGDRVVDLLPADRRPRTMVEDVTVHHLLSHTSGIGDYAEEDEGLPGYVEDYASLWVERPVQSMERPDDFLPLYAEADPVAMPGDAYHYSNAGYVLLGAVLEQVAARPFAEVIEERVFGPAGMGSSGYFRSDEARPDVAVGYLPRSVPGVPWRTNVFSVPVVGGGDGGAHVTARDVDHFLRAVATGDLLGPALTARMLTRHVPVEDGFDMGYGVLIRPGDGGFAKDGGDPGIETLARHMPVEDVSMVVLCNGEGMLGPVWEMLGDALGT